MAGKAGGCLEPFKRISSDRSHGIYMRPLLSEQSPVMFMVFSPGSAHLDPRYSFQLNQTGMLTMKQPLGVPYDLTRDLTWLLVSTN